MKAVVFTLGCKVNKCESDSLLYGLKEKNYEVSEELGFADLYILNTCAVTAEAEKKSRQAIARIRKFNPDAKIIVTGCCAEKSPDVFLKKEGVKLVTGTKAKDKILDMLGDEGIKIECSDEYYEKYLPALSDRTRVYVKVQDGCNNFCAYCIVPYLRGRSRSRSVESVRRELDFLSPKEAVITGINLSAYEYNGTDLAGLIEKLKDYDFRIRLGSLEVKVIDRRLLDALSALKCFAPHFHLSLQSGSDKVLKEMNRRYTAEEFREKVALIREYFPSSAVTTDIIVGYSTETEEDFEQSYLFAKEISFADIHCFPYSRREGTKAYALKELPESVKRERLEKMLNLKAELKQKFAEQNVGKERTVLIEETKDGFGYGYTENYLRLKAENGTVGEMRKVTVSMENIINL